MKAPERLSALARSAAHLPVGLMRAFDRTERLVFLGALLSFVVVHLLTAVPAFGEDDQARFAFDAVTWHLRGAIDVVSTDYRMRTSPLYVHSLKGVLDLGLPISALPRFMNHVNLFFSGVVLAAMYVLFRPLAGRAAAGLACGLFSVTPAAWLGASYGMAHVPALAFWLLGLLVFSSALEANVTRRGYLARIGLTVLLAWCALSLKADVILTGLAFPGLLLVKRRLSWVNVVAACGIVLAALGLQLLYAKGVVTAETAGAAAARAQEPVHEHLARLNKRFPFELRGLTHFENVASITNAPGKLLFAVSLLAVAAGLVTRAKLQMAIWAVAWSLPLMLFWVLVIGNSARHNLAALPPLLLLTADLLLRLADTRLRAGLLVALVLCMNYVSDVRGAALGHGTMVPRTDLLALSEGVNAKSQKHAKLAADFAALPSPKKAGVERFLLAFGQFAVAAEGQRVGRISYDGTDFRISRPGGSVQTVRLTYAANAARARQTSQKLRAEGFDVFSTDYKMRDLAAPARR